MSDASRNNLPLALALVERGWAIFPGHTEVDGRCSCGRPCQSPAKHPMTPHGFYDATKDPDKVRAIWEDTSWANVCVRTGYESGILVIDVDGEAGIEALARLEEQYGPLPRTPTVRTGSGGRHYYFALPPGVEIGSGQESSSFPFDWRCDGGYAIAAGRNMEGEYVPIVGFEVPVAAIPDWLVGLVPKKSKAPRVIREATALQCHYTPASSVFAAGEELDLETDPGAPEGQRHSRALKLVGSYLGLGITRDEIEPLLLAWADRCRPRMDKKEALRILDDLAAKDANRHSIVDVSAAGGSGQAKMPWPDLDERAYYGLPGEIVQAIRPQTEADPVAILVQVLVFFGNVIGRNPYFLVESTPHHTNLFAVLVGETAKGRKGTSEGRVRELFRQIDPSWLPGRIMNGLSSGEGLIWAVRDPIEKEEPIKEKGLITGYQSVITDRGIKDKRLLVIEPEFASVLRIAKREGNTLSPTIRSAWDSGRLQLMTKNSAVAATDAHISIIGHITREELLASLSDVEGFNGFANRYLWLCVVRSQLLPEGGAFVDLSAFESRLLEAVEFARSVGRMIRDEAATILWAKLYKEMSRSLPGLLGAVTNRAEAQVLRLSMIYALLDRRDTIGVEHLEAAMAVWQYAEDSARYVFGSSTGDSLADRVLAIIRAEPATRREIHARLSGHCKAQDLDRVLEFLKDKKLARAESLATGGRPAQRWTAN